MGINPNINIPVAEFCLNNYDLLGGTPSHATGTVALPETNHTGANTPLPPTEG